ncbi:MAG: AraC family transcriptional regulator [Cyclobacteriaceae bacterium]|jgi:AraC-like DNA-binding protein|nr:AraC family transcriptional regulator [Cyclobacteriaceae bacterium]
MEIVKEINTHKSKFHTLLELEDIRLEIAENKEEYEVAIVSQVTKNIIHFYFCMDGAAVFAFGPHYMRTIEKQRNYFFYNPDSNLPFELRLSPTTRIVALSITLESLHKLFSHDALPFLKPENVKSKFYDEREIPTQLLIVLNQLFTTHVSESVEKLYYHGKVLELLGLYFSDKKPDTESCPFLNDQETVRKIKHAKEYLLKHMETPPGLKELAKIAGLNEYQLKVGFKEIYGNTVFGYLLDHKLDHARVLLDSSRFQVNEVAYQIGYANPSHFIAAFKKKFGVTPKKYLMNLTRKV